MTTSVPTAPTLIDPSAVGHGSSTFPHEHKELPPTDAVAKYVVAARRAFPGWSQSPLSVRLNLLDRFRGSLVAHLDELARLLAEEIDKPRLDAVAEVFHSCNLIRYYVRNAAKLLANRSASSFPMVHERAWIEYRPFGVVGVVSPWNYPLILPLASIVPALAAGNVVVVKPSEHATRTAVKLNEIWQDLQPPIDVWSTAVGGPEVATALARAGVDKLAFTGGSAGGKAVYQAAAETGTPVLMELGGSDAAIVDADADIQRAAHGVVWGAFFNAGQSCIGVRRCFVHERIYDAFLKEAAASTARLVVGPAIENRDWSRDWTRDSSSERQSPYFSKPAGEPDLGCVRTQKQIDHLNQVLQDALSKGAHTLAPVQLPLGRYFPPTILVDVDESMRVAKEEVFGPLLAVFRFDQVEEAVDKANALPFGLGASVWSNGNARSIARRLQVGGVALNDALIHFAAPGLPFGGVKKSGFGRTQGPEGLHEFCQTVAFVEHRFGPRNELHWFASPGRRIWIERFLHFFHGPSLWSRWTALFRSRPPTQKS